MYFVENIYQYIHLVALLISASKICAYSLKKAVSNSFLMKCLKNFISSRLKEGDDSIIFFSTCLAMFTKIGITTESNKNIQT